MEQYHLSLRHKEEMVFFFWLGIIATIIVMQGTRWKKIAVKTRHRYLVYINVLGDLISYSLYGSYFVYTITVCLWQINSSRGSQLLDVLANNRQNNRESLE
jgi:hypothetical protein